jgi:hypothetical protein
MQADQDRRELKSSAMGTVPFAMSAELRNAMSDFKVGNTNWVELVSLDGSQCYNKVTLPFALSPFLLHFYCLTHRYANRY